MVPVVSKPASLLSNQVQVLTPSSETLNHVVIQIEDENFSSPQVVEQVEIQLTQPIKKKGKKKGKKGKKKKKLMGDQIVGSDEILLGEQTTNQDNSEIDPQVLNNIQYELPQDDDDQQAISK